jgi:hypothetical protein
MVQTTNVSPSLSLTFPIQAAQAGDVRSQDECQQGTHTRTQRMAQKGDAVACRSSTTLTYPGQR